MESFTDNVSIPLLTNMYNGTYKYTLNKYREALCVNTDVSSVDNYLLKKMDEYYIPSIKQRIAEIKAIPLIEQKSPEWFKLREGMISASDAGYFLKTCGVSKALDALKIKLGLKNYMNSTAPPLLHGNTYEDITRAIYESRNRVRVFEHGILSSKTDCIGASPDGIVVECLDNTFNCKSRYGRLLEIKNPYSRVIDSDIKPEYMVQILQQQYTMILPICDFVETTIIDKYCKGVNDAYPAYETLDDLLNDKYVNAKHPVKNPNIPIENLTKYGNEKGIVIWYQLTKTMNDIRNKYIIYPLDSPYNARDIEKWIVDTNSEQFQSGFIFKEIKYWRLMVYCEKTVIYDQKLYEDEYIPKLCNIWSIIQTCRKLTSREQIEKYIEEMENTKDNPFYNENKIKKRLKSLSRVPSTTMSLSDNKDFELDF